MRCEKKRTTLPNSESHTVLLLPLLLPLLPLLLLLLLLQSLCIVKKISLQRDAGMVCNYYLFLRHLRAHFLSHLDLSFYHSTCCLKVTEMICLKAIWPILQKKRSKVSGPPTTKALNTAKTDCSLTGFSLGLEPSARTLCSKVQ